MKLTQQQVIAHGADWQAWLRRRALLEKIEVNNRRMEMLACGPRQPTRWKRIRKWKHYELQDRKMTERLCKIDY